MFPTLFKAYLILSLVVGQSLCCCTVQATAGATAPRQVELADAEQKDETAGHSCSCKKPDSGKECPPPDDSKQPHKCPCRGNHHQGAVSVPAKVDLGSTPFALEHLLLVDAHWAGLTLTGSVETAILQRSLYSALPTGKAILRALHVLRC